MQGLPVLERPADRQHVPLPTSRSNKPGRRVVYYVKEVRERESATMMRWMMFGRCNWTGGNNSQPVRNPGARRHLVTLASSLVAAFGIAATVDVARSSPGATGNLMAASTPGARTGLSRSRPAIDARGLSQSRRGLSRRQRPNSQSYRGRSRFRNFGNDRYFYGYKDRYRSSSCTRINIYADGRTTP